MHYTEIEYWPFKNFSPQELACPCCGEFYPDYTSIYMLQFARFKAAIPFYLSSAHRCPIHNARVRGAPKSMHKQIAFDIRVNTKNRFKILEACKYAGFKGFGYYSTFLHVDNGRSRFWYGNKVARSLWNG